MPSLARYAWLSVAAALVTMALKGVAAWLTGSLGLLSDALESFVNLGAALIAVYTLRVAAREPDDKHPFGYTKAEYFSSAVEGGLIMLAALAIVATAVPRLMAPQPIVNVDTGIFVSLVAGADHVYFTGGGASDAIFFAIRGAYNSYCVKFSASVRLSTISNNSISTPLNVLRSKQKHLL